MFGLSGWRVDLRPWVLQVPTQEVPTSDGITVKITIAAETSVSDAAAFVGAAQDAIEMVYLAIQVALRDVLAATSIEQLLSERSALAGRLAETVSDVSAVGVSLGRIEIKDIILPAELKRAQSEVLLARAQGQAALERARAESAALRSLVNAARLAADHPELLELRLIQQLGASSGHTVVIGASSGKRRPAESAD
jgi:regulator of protease activity HflC (stomatin/prohibitin superfamily)